MRVSLVAAVADNGVIGKAGDMPWRLSSDMKNFRRITMGKPVIMGRKTWDGLPRALDGRANIVISRNPDFNKDGVHRAKDVTAAIELGEKLAAQAGEDEIMIIGGGEIYEQALTFADCIYKTEVHDEPVGDTIFPKLDSGHWRETYREAHEPGPKDSAAFDFVVLERAG